MYIFLRDNVSQKNGGITCGRMDKMARNVDILARGMDILAGEEGENGIGTLIDTWRA